MVLFSVPEANVCIPFHDHHATSFGVMRYSFIDTTKTSTSSSDANFVASSDITDPRYMCDTPMSGSSNCSCSVGTGGLVGSAGRTFPGSAVGASQTATMGPLGIQAPPEGTPHPSFRFAQKVSDVTIRMTDVTKPGTDGDLMWDAQFRLTGPDGSVGSDFLPSSLPPIGGGMRSFHKMCAPLNSWHNYQIKVIAGGDAPLDQTIAVKAEVMEKPVLVDPTLATADGGNGEDSAIEPGTGMKATGDRLTPLNDSAPAVRSSSFAAREMPPTESPYYVPNRGTFFVKSPSSATAVPAVTSTTFAASHEKTSFDGCNPPPLRNPPNCHRPPVVTIHSPNMMAGAKFF